MQTIVYHSKARKTMCGMGTFCLIGMISFQLTMQNGDAIKKNQTNIFETRQEIACTGDVKLVLRSTDADNCCGIEAQDADGNVLGRFGFYPHYGGWSIDGKPIATK